MFTDQQLPQFNFWKGIHDPLHFATDREIQ